MITRTMFVIAVRDLDRSASFYRDVLGFDVRAMGDPGWRMFVCDSCRIMAGHCPDTAPAETLGDHSYFAYLVVDDAAALHDRVTVANAQIVNALADEPWGMREFGLRTIDGHRIMVGQPLDAA